MLSKILRLALLCVLSQFCQAGQLHEVDVANCPTELQIYNGDTVRFINHSAEAIDVYSALFSFFGIGKDKYVEYKFTPSLDNALFILDRKINYTCGKSSVVLRVSAAPVAIFPKQFVDTTGHLQDYSPSLDINIYVLSDEGHVYAWDPNVKNVSILLNGKSIFTGDFAAYKSFIKSLGSMVTSLDYLNANCTFFANAYAACRNAEKGFMVTRFRVPKAVFTSDRSYFYSNILQIKLTLSTPKGDVEYEDQAEYVFFSSGDFSSYEPNNW